MRRQAALPWRASGLVAVVKYVAESLERALAKSIRVLKRGAR